MVDAVAVDLIAVDVLEGELHAVIHVEAALGLANQAQIGVVHQHVDVGQLELRAHRQLLDHELEVIVTRQRHHLGLGIRPADTQGSRDGPAQGAGLTAVDPVAWPIDVQELGAGDL